MANPTDSLIVQGLERLQELGARDQVAAYMQQAAPRVRDNAGYWQLLAAAWIWAGDTTRLQVWRPLFEADRPKRDRLMKKGDRRRWRALPPIVTAWRACLPLEPAGVFCFTMTPEVIARAYGPGREVRRWTFPRDKVVAYWTRRGESELIVLDQSLTLHRLGEVVGATTADGGITGC